LRILSARRVGMVIGFKGSSLFDPRLSDALDRFRGMSSEQI
jgi:hypothetical protein